MDVSWPPFRMMSRLEKIRFSTFAVGVRNRFSLENLMWDNIVADDGSSLWYAKVSTFRLGVDGPLFHMFVAACIDRMSPATFM